ncbi:MAG: uridylate kinase [Polyangiaceae bacterium]|nr:uridylate kinase [Polyangiaceae bacterium]
MKDARHHLGSLLMRESLVDKGVVAGTDGGATVRMLPDVSVVKIGASSIIDKGSAVVSPVVEALGRALSRDRLIISTGGGARTRHVLSIGIDLGLPTGVLAQLAMADSLGNAHILGTLLAPFGVVAIPPEMFGHLLPLFVRAVPGVIWSGEPPYSLWEHPPQEGRIPPHRTDTGTYLVGECFGCKQVILVKDVDGLYERDPKRHQGAARIAEIGARELARRDLETLPFDRALLGLLQRARLVDRFQIVSGLIPGHLEAALRGERPGSVVYRD